ncbi:hypothetical protein NITLEN_70031 [Nitrospira lenta]|uniref:Uncharacterized protein n=1 Tax=Nitrospira lenta TaxID=1436998 RepID=A0A330L9P9_9BACT|nr:hypothetical protein NITLEN_70031 [Nitrospira lenta]
MALLESGTMTPLAGVTAGLTQTDSLFRKMGTVPGTNVCDRGMSEEGCMGRHCESEAG